MNTSTSTPTGYVLIGTENIIPPSAAPTVVSSHPASRACAVCVCRAWVSAYHSSSVARRHIHPNAPRSASRTHLPQATGAVQGTRCQSVRPYRKAQKGVRCAVCDQGVSGARKAVDPKFQPTSPATVLFQDCTPAPRIPSAPPYRLRLRLRRLPRPPGRAPHTLLRALHPVGLYRGTVCVGTTLSVTPSVSHPRARPVRRAVASVSRAKSVVRS